ncbi:GxxExxY protein [Tautonia plasticadhaerens]|uniref:GxxExxY protein n=1 Tax=Tautonia plasticadhaerens TaxID=2527974 RepID=UPI0018D2297B
MSGEVMDAAYRIHTAPGLGLMESVSEATMAYELRARGLEVETQKVIPWSPAG